MIYVKKHPWTWAVAGFILGAILGSKAASKDRPGCKD